MSDGARKRSRFDQTEPEPRRQSRFDRRSRSPPGGPKSSSRRSRSPLDKSASKSPGASSDPAAAAAAAAARINAQIQAKKGPQHSDAHSAGSPSTPGSNKPAGASGDNVNGEVYQQDGDFIKDIEVNDLRNRYTLTKGATQKMIKEETGADVTTRGNYYPDKSMATAANPPLYLHVTSQSKEGLDKAMKKIEELMQQELPNLIDERRFRRREPEQVERDEMGRRKWPEERIPIDLEPIPGFNLRANVIGHGGAYVKHIAGETGCRVQIKGRGSQFSEHGTNSESDEPMYLHVFGPDAEQVKRAKELCEDLLGEVRSQYQAFKDRGGAYNRQQNYQNNRGSQDYNGGGGGGGSGGYHNHRNSQQHNQQYGGYGHGSNAADASATGAANAASAQQQGDYAQQYAQYYGNTDAASAAAAAGGADPYAAYGGYQNYVQLYYQYYAAAQAQEQQQQQQQQAGENGQAAAPPPPPPPGTDAGTATTTAPPPPPTETPPPPPPPPGTAPGAYSAVPPPPGM